MPGIRASGGRGLRAEQRRRARDEAIIEACRQSVGKPIVYACVLREEQKQAGGVAAPPAPKDESAAGRERCRPCPGRFRGSAAHHRRHHGDPRQRKTE